MHSPQVLLFLSLPGRSSPWPSSGAGSVTVRTPPPSSACRMLWTARCVARTRRHRGWRSTARSTRRPCKVSPGPELDRVCRPRLPVPATCCGLCSGALEMPAMAGPGGKGICVKTLALWWVVPSWDNGKGRPRPSLETDLRMQCSLWRAPDLYLSLFGDEGCLRKKGRAERQHPEREQLQGGGIGWHLSSGATGPPCPSQSRTWAQ